MTETLAHRVNHVPHKPRMAFSQPDDRILVVWLYRGWCWLCRCCKAGGYHYPSQAAALAAALDHCREVTDD